MKSDKPFAKAGSMAAMRKAEQSGFTQAFAAALVLCLGVGVAQAQPVPAVSDSDTSDNGRYTMAPAADGFIRLDTRTGEVSTCRSKGGWICRLAPDERAALDVEIGRLQRENETLKEQLAAERGGTITGKIDAPLAKEDSQKHGAPSHTPDRDTVVQNSSDHDRLMAVLERVWQRLVDMAASIQKQLSEKI